MPKYKLNQGDIRKLARLRDKTQEPVDLDQIMDLLADAYCLGWRRCKQDHIDADLLEDPKAPKDLRVA
jgi:hypothetical protein